MAVTLLPANVAAIAKAAGTGGRYATDAVKLTPNELGYRVEATTGHILARVDGIHVENPVNYPLSPALAAAPNGATSALVDAKTWTEALKLAPKIGKRSTTPPIMRNVAAVVGEQEVTFGACDLVNEPRSLTAPVHAGRFPDTDRVQPTTAPLARIVVDAELLATLLRVAAQFAPEDTARVTIEIRADGKPVVVRTGNGTQTFTGLLQPLA